MLLYMLREKMTGRDDQALPELTFMHQLPDNCLDRHYWKDQTTVTVYSTHISTNKNYIGTFQTFSEDLATYYNNCIQFILGLGND